MLRGAQHDKTGEGSCRGAEKQRAGSPIHETSCSSWLNDRGFKFSGLRFRLARSARERAEDLSAPSETDRKSTCLNSSHQIISYAVFCLKKKKKETRTIIHATITTVS